MAQLIKSHYVLGLALAVLGLFTPAQAIEPVSTSLAAEYPQSVILLSMPVRGAFDFFTFERSAPASVQQLADKGYMPYIMPEATEFTFRIVDEGRAVEVISHGPPFMVGNFQKVGILRRGFPQPGLSHTRKLALDNGKTVEVKSYLFDTAEYMENGVTIQEAAKIQARLRILYHLNFALNDYRAIRGHSPKDLATLESFVGAARNPVAWQGIQVVKSPAAVSGAQGNLFFASDSRGSLVAINVGPEIVVFRHGKDMPVPQGWKELHTGLY